MVRHCKAGQDNEFGFVRFFGQLRSGTFQACRWSPLMFVFNRSAYAVLAPLALLIVVAWLSNRVPETPGAQAESAAAQGQAVAANLPSR
jgi:hypothetical protein